VARDDSGRYTFQAAQWGALSSSGTTTVTGQWQSNLDTFVQTDNGTDAFGRHRYGVQADGGVRGDGTIAPADFALRTAVQGGGPVAVWLTAAGGGVAGNITIAAFTEPDGGEPIPLPVGGTLPQGEGLAAVEALG